MRLRVLHVIYDDVANPWVGGGGAARVAELYARLAGEVDATVASGNYPGAHDTTDDGVRYCRVGARRPYAVSRLTHAIAATRLLHSATYDAAVVDFSGYSPVYVPAGRPVGITVHHLAGPTAVDRWGALPAAAIARIERTLVRRATRLSATSLATQAALRVLAPGVPIDLVYAGVPDTLFAAPRRPEGYLLYFGRLDIYHKGLDVLLHAFARLLAARPGLELRIAGRGTDGARLQALAHSLGVDAHVRLMGAVSAAERQALLAGARVQLMPSRFEGFGMAAAEAMAAGVPLVASDAGALPEVLDGGRGGIVVPVDDAGALAAAVGRLLDDDSAREALSRSARRSAERFRWTAVAADHLAFLHRIAAHSCAGSPTPPPS